MKKTTTTNAPQTTNANAVKLRMSRETIRAIRVRTSVRTGEDGSVSPPPCSTDTWTQP